MNSNRYNDQALAFAGILQALQLVQNTAYGRPCDLGAMQASLRSVLKLDASSVVDVYAGIPSVAAGLRLLQTQLMSRNKKPDMELSRYLVTLLHLERKLSKRPDLLDRIRAGVERAQQQAQHFDISHASVLANLAETYSATLSTLQPRILVNGNPSRLADTAAANQIRALLLAAMRSAVLWRQCGGSRTGLLFGRKKLIGAAAQLLR